MAVPLRGRERPARTAGRQFFLLPLAGDSEAELDRRTAEVMAWDDDTELAAAADRLWAEAPATAPHRRVVLASSAAEARASLAAPGTATVATGGPAADALIGFCFSGLGEPIGVLGEPLYRANPEFRAVLDRLDALAVARTGRPLALDVLRTASAPDADEGAPPEAAARSPFDAARRAERSVVRPPRPALPVAEDQTLRFAVGYAMARAWIAAGVSPGLLVGHSLGEYVAACVADVFSEADALELVALRAELVARLPAGGMLAVCLPAERIGHRLTDGLVVSAVNAPSLTTVSGGPDALASLAGELREEGVPYRFLDVDRPFHSPLLAAVGPALAGAVGAVARQPPRLRWISTVTGRWMRAQDAVDPQYWARHTSAPVNYLAALRLALRAQPAALVEVGPGEGLTTFSAHARLESGGRATDVFASVQRSPYWRSDTASWLHALGRLWAAGAHVDWPALRSMTTGAGPTESEG